MKSDGFKSVREHQKVNHFPGSFAIGRKDRLWRSLSRMQSLHGKKVLHTACNIHVYVGMYFICSCVGVGLCSSDLCVARRPVQPEKGLGRRKPQEQVDH